MTIKTFTFNPFQENTYVVYDETKEAIIIDAGCILEHERKLIKQFLAEHNLRLVQVLNTHLHLDHQFGNKFIFDNYGLMPAAHKEDEFLLENIKAQGAYFGIPIKEETQPLGSYLNEDEVVRFGNSMFTILHVPGHSPGSIAFYSEEGNCAFVGDVIFRGSIGRTDLVKGDYATLIRSIQTKLLPLPDSTEIYSGHGPVTTIGYEKVNNPYL